MKIMYRLGAAIAVASMLSGCATITRGTKQNFVITTNPDGALATLSTGESCTTPCKIKLKRKKEFHVTITKDGYQTVETDIQSKFKGGAALAGNAIFGGLIGGGIDASNGSLNSLKPNPLEVTLTPVGGTAPTPAK